MYISTYVWIWLDVVNASELRRWLTRRGCTFEGHRGGSGHLTVRLETEMPMHGSSKELGTGQVNKIKKDLGLR
jgi:mRNA interferase HicA